MRQDACVKRADQWARSHSPGFALGHPAGEALDLTNGLRRTAGTALAKGGALFPREARRQH